MDFTSLLENLGRAVVIVSIPILVKYICGWLSALKNEVPTNMDFYTVSTTALDIIQKTVDKVSQTYVDALKAADKFDVEAQKTAFNMALTDIKAQFSDNMNTILSALVGDMDKWIGAQIESYIYNKKG